MEQFLGLSRDASREKAETGTSPYNRNIVYSKKLGSITQEDGFEFCKELVGVVIGVYSTNTHIIYITYNPLTSKTLISYKEIATNTLVNVINTSYFDYEPTRPIEIIGWYNYNQELLIMFSDGVFEKSSAPRLINLMDTDVLLNGSKEFVSARAADSTLLFSIINQPVFSIEYGNQGNHTVDLVFFTIAYVLPDGITRTRFIGNVAEAFPLYAFKSEYKREVIFSIKDLDLFFNQFIIGMVVYKDNAIFGYTTDILSYSTSTYDYAFTSLTNLNSVGVDEILVENFIFDKVKSLTIGDDTVIAGGVTVGNTKSYQKYANNLKLNLYFDERKDNRHQAPLLCPDEVYYMTIALAFENGNFSEEYHIPNRDAFSTTVNTINKATMGLTDIAEELEDFQVINTGDWVNPSVGLPNFNNLSETKLSWGVWFNEEVYPNDANYNGLIDYDGTTALIDGIDLRGRRVSLHRVPGLDNLSKKFPMKLGMDITNDNPSGYDMHNRLPAFSINVENFMDCFFTVIATDKIKGYRLSFVKKDETSKIVEDVNFIKPLVHNKDIIVLGDINEAIDHTVNTNYSYTVETFDPLRSYFFGFSKVNSVNLSIYKGGKASKIIKANYALFNDDIQAFNTTEIPDITKLDSQYRTLENDLPTTGTIGEYSQVFTLPVIPVEALIYKIPQLVDKFATIKSIVQNAGNSKLINNNFMNETVKIKVNNSLHSAINTVGFTDSTWNPLNMNSAGSSFTLQGYNPSTSAYETKTITNSEAYRINVCTTLLNVKKNIHFGLNPKEFVVIGTTNITNSTEVFKDFGDTFTNNIYNDIYGYVRTTNPDAIFFFQRIYSGMISINNNVLIYFEKDKKLGLAYLTAGDGGDVDKLVAFDYTLKSSYKESTRQLNSLIANVAFNYNKKYTNKFPFRILKSLTIQSENLSTFNVRAFLPNAYYDMPSMKGEITYVVGFDKGVYCQQKYSLSIFQLKEKLSNNDENTAYLAEADLFAYKPQTIIDEDNKGYIGSVHQFGKKLSKSGLVTIDAERGKVYLIAGNQPKELSKIKMENFFREELGKLLQYIVPTLFNNTAVQDNPYNGNGILIGIDDKNNRILITINNYKVKQSALDANIDMVDGLPFQTDYLTYDTILADIKKVNISTNNSKTISFNSDWQRWVAEHDYIPQFYINTNKNNYAGVNIINLPNTGATVTADVYITNNNSKTGKYFYRTDNTIYESFTDLLFNSRYDLTKWYKSVLWRTTVNSNTNKNLYEKTINAVILYTDYQCSGRIELDTEQFNLVRNSEGIWNFNDFRDMVIDSNDLPIREDGSFASSKVHLNRIWFEKSDFISNFIIIRLIMNNIEDTKTHIHNVNVESRISNRI